MVKTTLLRSYKFAHVSSEEDDVQRMYHGARTYHTRGWSPSTRCRPIHSKLCKVESVPR